MKRINLLLIFMFVMLAPSFASFTYIDNQEIAQERFNEDTIVSYYGVYEVNDPVGTSVEDSIRVSFTTDTYLLLGTYEDTNNSWAVIEYFDPVLLNFRTINYTIPQNGVTYVLLEPQVDIPTFDLVIRQTSGAITYGIGFSNNDDINSFKSIYGGLIQGMIDLININLSIWRLGYYMFIFAIVLGFFGGIILMALRFYRYIESIKPIKKSNKRGN